MLTGTLIRRHRIAHPAPDDDVFYTVEDFNIGQQLSLYDRVFSIVVSILCISALTSEGSVEIIHPVLAQDCDEFTRNFLRKLGVRVPVPLECPSDPYTTLREQVSNLTATPTLSPLP